MFGSGLVEFSGKVLLNAVDSGAMALALKGTVKSKEATVRKPRTAVTTSFFMIRTSC